MGMSEEQILETLKAVEESEGNKTHAAIRLGISTSSLRDRLATAARRGFTSREPVMPGFAIKKVSSNGEKEWIQQAPLGDEFQVPEGHSVKGVSALVDGHGNLIQQWIKTKGDVTVQVQQALIDTFKEYSGLAVIPEAPTYHNDDLLTMYPIADHHLGMYAWQDEAGENYDLSIGESLLRRSMSTLVAGAPHSSTAIILNLGDFFHTDDDTSRTPKGTTLDVDSRYAKVLRVGVNLLIHCTQQALTKHQKVILRCLPGNHDPYASIALAVGLSCYFDGHERVQVDTDPSVFFKHQFGRVLLTATHGHMAKPDRLAGIVAASWPEVWGATTHRYAYLGHVHHKSRGGEEAGLIWETFQTLAPKDVWHYGMGYRSGRSMVAITHHRMTGELQRHTVSVTREVGHEKNSEETSKEERRTTVR